MNKEQKGAAMRRIGERVNAFWLQVLDFGAPVPVMQPVAVRAVSRRSRFVSMP